MANCELCGKKLSMYNHTRKCFHHVYPAYHNYRKIRINDVITNDGSMRIVSNDEGEKTYEENHTAGVPLKTFTKVG